MQSVAESNMSEPRERVVWRWLAALLGMALLTGCAGEPPRPAPDPSKVELAVADRAGYDAAIAKLRGHVVLVDFWASWCEPCVANFPHMIALADQHWNDGLRVVTVSMDSSAAADKTLAFLTAQRAGVATNLISQFGGGSQSVQAFEIPHGALPCYKLYDRMGKLRQVFALDPAAKQQYSLQEVDTAVELLLAE
jgi:thiol-disulfide isomerase/thioredoxin